MEDKFGYHQDIKNGDGIIRARTIGGHLRSWEIPRTMNALEVIKKEWGNLEYPGIYILFDSSGKKVYIGEAKDIYSRLKTHLTSPEDKIKNWDRAIIINDGRSATQSDFNDTVIRKSLELHLISLFKANRYTVVAQGEPQKHNPQQKSLFQALKEEFNFFLMKKNLITKLIDKPGQEEILRDELKKILEKKGYKIESWKADEAVLNSEKAYIRPGSPKPKNNPKHWQITFRDVFKDSLQKGEGCLLVPRDGILLIPLKEVQKVVTDSSKYKQNTIDVYVNFKEEAIELTYTTNMVDVTQFRLIK
ncbi:MAG: hypothetical protein FJ266_01210 [Planctomycetes bacterium]|nr:hypothetical protein [Planctomycetota bacterium]